MRSFSRSCRRQEVDLDQLVDHATGIEQQLIELQARGGGDADGRCDAIFESLVFDLARTAERIALHSRSATVATLRSPPGQDVRIDAPSA